MSVSLRWNEPYGVVATLEGEYAVEELEQAFETAFPDGGSAGPLILLDLRASLQDHTTDELRALAGALCARSDTIWVRTRDVLRYGFARELMGYCDKKGVTVRIEHEDPL